MILYAQATDTLLHAAQTAGESNTVILTYYMTDESGNKFTDESGNYFILLQETTGPLLHAAATDTLTHAE